MRHFLTLLFVAICFQSNANVRLPALVSNGMVLQRNAVIHIWGWADKNEKVTVRFLNQKQQTPVAVIQQGTWADEKVVVSTMGSIAGLVEEQGLSNPAVIVIGEVVSLHPQFVREEVVRRFV